MRLRYSEAHTEVVDAHGLLDAEPRLLARVALYCQAEITSQGDLDRLLQRQVERLALDRDIGSGLILPGGGLHHELLRSPAGTRAREKGQHQQRQDT